MRTSGGSHYKFFSLEPVNFPLLPCQFYIVNLPVLTVPTSGVRRIMGLRFSPDGGSRFDVTRPPTSRSRAMPKRNKPGTSSKIDGTVAAACVDRLEDYLPTCCGADLALMRR